MWTLLDEALMAATSVASASQIVVDRLVASGLTKPSVYLVRGDRIRIQAVAGYHQIFDGMPFGVGVIGQSYSRDEPVVIDDVSADPTYLQANPGVGAEVCVPVRLDGRVVGVVNVESDEPLPRERVDEVFAAASSFERALARLGHDVTESPAQRLVRHATRLTGISREDDLRDAVIAAATDVAGMAWGALLLPDRAGRFHTVAATGRLADALADVEDEAIAAIAALVQAGCSCYTTGGTTETAAELAALRAHGAEAVVAIPLGATHEGRGVLLLADHRPLVPETTDVELLEMLTAHVSSCLKTVNAVDELRTRAASDPLTGLGHHATFHAALASARAGREPIAVLVVDVDGFKEINDSRGHQAGDRTIREIAAALAGALRRGDELFRVGGDEFAAIVRVAVAHEAVDIGTRLREAVARLGETTISVGVAVPTDDETDAALLARADRALYSVKAEGRDGVALDLDRHPSSI